jgi:hypothetical protein
VAFQRLLHRRSFAPRIRGGIYIIEIKYRESGWNIHLHALIDALFLKQATISDAWREITGDSYIVDVRRAWSPRKGLKYVLKYMLKAPSLNGHELDYDSVLKGTRLAQTFGAFYRARLQKSGLACPRCGHTDWISEFQLARASLYGSDGFLSDVFLLSLPPPPQKVSPTLSLFED